MRFTKFSRFVAHSLGFNLMLSCCNFFDTFAMESKPKRETSVKHNWEFKNYDCRSDCPNKSSNNSYSLCVKDSYGFLNMMYSLCSECAKDKIKKQLPLSRLA